MEEITANLSEVELSDESSVSRKVIPIRRNAVVPEDVTTSPYDSFRSISSVDESPKRYFLELEEKRSIINKELFKDLLHESFYLIIDCSDPDFDYIERSNSFDLWKDSINQIARKDLGLTTKHRQIIGALIPATSKKDLTDFSPEQIQLFQEATSCLRKISLTKGDIKFIIAKMRSANILKSVWLGVE